MGTQAGTGRRVLGDETGHGGEVVLCDVVCGVICLYIDMFFCLASSLRGPELE